MIDAIPRTPATQQVQRRLLSTAHEFPGWVVTLGMVERELLVTGIGGQGVQLAAQVLASAAIAEGSQVQLFGSYGGMMRGGNTDATLVFADGPIEAPPTVSHAWSAIVMHHELLRPACSDAVAEGRLVVVNSTVFAPSSIAVDAHGDRGPRHRHRGRGSATSWRPRW